MRDVSNEDVGNRHSGGPSRSWKTSPLTSTFYESPKSSLLFAAQSRAFRDKQLQNQPSTSSTHKTPKLSRTNPFEDISSLEYDKCSPGLFVVRQSSAEKGEFRWSIEDISRIMPAQIDSPQSVFEEHFDEETESAAQEAIERYFSFRHAVVTPPNSQVVGVSPSEMCTPPAEVLMIRAAMGCRSSSSIKDFNCGSIGMASAISSTPCARSAAERRLVIKVDECTQTQLSLPPILPPEVESVLRPYFSNKDDNCETEEGNISSTTLRRKLFSNENDILSPVKTEVKSASSVNVSPERKNIPPVRIDWTPEEKSEHHQFYCLSSPDISPIKFKTSFEFTKNMSIDCSSINANELNDNAVEEQSLMKLTNSENCSSPSEENKMYSHTRNIFSSTAQSCQIDRSDKDTGYSTIEIDCALFNK